MNLDDVRQPGETKGDQIRRLLQDELAPEVLAAWDVRVVEDAGRLTKLQIRRTIQESTEGA